MKNAIAIQLLGDQPHPNILFIEEFATEIHTCYLVATKKTEGIVDLIVSTTSQYGIHYETILVKEDDLMEIQHKIGEKIQGTFDAGQSDADTRILGNITGGTKVMSIALFNYLRELGADGIYYLTLAKNTLFQVYPQKKYGEQPLKTRLSLIQYLRGAGLESPNDFATKNKYYRQETAERDLAAMYRMFTGPMRSIAMQATMLIVRFRLRDKLITPDKHPDIFPQIYQLKEGGFVFESAGSISKKETKFLSGDWLEALLYRQVLRALSIPEENAGISVQLKKGGADNEYDVMFIHQNTLYVIECKTSVADYRVDDSIDTNTNDLEKIKDLFASTLYKASSLRADFGLQVRFFLAALHDFDTLKEEQKDRAKKLGIGLIGLEELNDDEKFRQKIGITDVA